MSQHEITLRVLLANFIVQVLPLLMIVVATILIVKARRGGPGSGLKHYLGISLAAFPAGIIAYIFSGIATAAIRKEGHFYSVPFGGYTTDNGPLVVSAVLWIALLFAVLAFLLRSRP